MWHSLTLVVCVIAFLSAHAVLGEHLHGQREELQILPAVPNSRALIAMSFGDKQYLYRALALEIQNAGDTGGRFTPIHMYDTAHVVEWLTALQRLDPKSSHYTALAAHYFSQNKEPNNLRQIAAFIDRDTDLEPERKWYWQANAVSIARDQLKDLEYALALSRKIVSFGPYVPVGQFWILQIEPILLADLGRRDEARDVMDRIVRRYGQQMTNEEKDWTEKFLEKLI